MAYQRWPTEPIGSTCHSLSRCGKREYAYDRKSHVGTLDKALDQADANGWIIVDMKNDWKRIFAFEKVK